MKDKLKNCFTLKETKEKEELKAVCDPVLDPGEKEKGKLL